MHRTSCLTTAPHRCSFPTPCPHAQAKNVDPTLRKYIMMAVFLLCSPFWFIYCFDLVLRSALADYKAQLSRRKSDASKDASTGGKKAAPMPGPAFYNRRHGSRMSFGSNSMSSMNALSAPSERSERSFRSPSDDGETTPKPAPMLGAAAPGISVSAKKLRFSDSIMQKGATDACAHCSGHSCPFSPVVSAHAHIYTADGEPDAKQPPSKAPATPPKPAHKPRAPLTAVEENALKAFFFMTAPIWALVIFLFWLPSTLRVRPIFPIHIFRPIRLVSSLSSP